MKIIATFSALFLIFFCIDSHAEESNALSLKLWSKNYERPKTLDFIKLALEKAAPKYGHIEIESYDIDTLAKATETLRANQTLDALVSGTDIQREKDLLPIYIPLERGLLGFRACMIKPENQSLFSDIQQAKQFKENQLYVGLGSAWPDRNIMLNNGFLVRHANNRAALIEMLRDNELQCFSRSMMEIDDELSANSAFSAEKRLAFIYPFADIIYLRKGATQLHQALEYGLKQAIEDRSYFELFDHYYSDVLQKYEFYFRKILVLNNNNISPKARRAINLYGIASFSEGGR